MTIRDALESDLETIAELLLLVHRMHVLAQPDTYRDISRDTALEFLAPRLADPNAYIRVAECDGEVQGYCSAAIQSRPGIPLFQPGKFIYVNEIVVRPAHRRSGVGRALVADLKQFAHENGIAHINLEVGGFNSQAKAFFQAQGFHVAREKMSARVDA